jgi:glycosyltransferase involved in cell wall biosynthesis
MFLDADDVLAPDTLEVLANGLISHPQGISACPWRRLELVSNRWISRPASCASRRAGYNALSAWLTGWYYPTSSVLWSRDAFILTGGWDEEAKVNQDGDLMMRALAMSIPLLETTGGTSYYRRMPEGRFSLSGKRSTYDGIATRIGVIENIARMLEERDQLDNYLEPISRAFKYVANDATELYSDLHKHARKKSRLYAPRPWFRGMTLIKRNFQRLAGTNKKGTKPTAAPPRDQVEEIDFGIDQADKILSLAVETLPNKNSAHRPLKSRPTVSVIIPVYNRAHLLPRALDSVLKQTYSDFEVLIVDDCSKDDPESVIASYQDPRLRYLRQPENRGVAAARNRGLREALAPFVAFLDDDDEWFPEKLSRQVELFLRSPPEVGLIYTGVETVMNEGSCEIQAPTERGNVYRKMLAKNCIHGGSSSMLRRNLITKIGFFDEKLLAIEDYEYWLRISRYYNFEYVEEALVRYHDIRAVSIDNDSRRSRNIQANLEARNQFYQKHQAEMKKEGVAHFFLTQSANRHMASHWNDIKAARRLALKAFFHAPTSRNTIVALATTLFPRQLINKTRELLYGSDRVNNENSDR